ncbi:hypothetical protein P7K49_002622 [Saguinus oedipus]|uniref:Uncharacterized protein n=1 Tax=Saguinus oedipus TaxID=9490 RepID=A0ABQ9WIU3_SAGOE|nr:hypothetical protein P7K49_002622 [Saguinus oedipus]
MGGSKSSPVKRAPEGPRDKGNCVDEDSEGLGPSSPGNRRPMVGAAAKARLQAEAKLGAALGAMAASGDTPTTPKHPKDSRENFFPAAVAPTAPDPMPADSVQRPSDAHAKPSPALAATTAVTTCPPSASASNLDPSKDPGPPQPHRPEATPSMASLGPGFTDTLPYAGPDTSSSGSCNSARLGLAQTWARFHLPPKAGDPSLLVPRTLGSCGRALKTL